MTQKIFRLLAAIFPSDIAYTHCDYPCGIYDPHLAQLAALTVIRMIDLIQEAHAQLKNPAENEVTLRNNLVRAIMIKDEHAELVKQEVRVIWGDYFKAEIKANFPDLDGLVHEIMQLASKTKQTAERDSALRLLDKVNRFAEIFWDSKGKQTKRAKAPYKPEEEIVYPVI